MPLNKSGSQEAFKQNVSTLMGDVGKSPHVQSRAQALAIAYDIKRRGRAEGGGLHTGPIVSAVPGRTDHHPMDVPAGCYVIPAEAVSNLGENNTLAGLKKLEEVCSSSPEEIRRFFGASARPPARAKGGNVGDDSVGHPVPINAAGGEYVMQPEILQILGHGSASAGHRVMDAWVMKKRKHHIKTLRKLPPPARD